MKRSSSSGMSLMLIELVVAICFFSVISGICVKLFVNAKTISDESAERSQAVLAAESAAECFKAAGGDASETADLLGGTRLADGTLQLGFDADWQRTEAAPVYRLCMEMTAAGPGPARARIAVFAEAGEETPLFVLETASAGEVRS